MAIIFAGKSTCAICQNILLATDEILMFPAFIHDRADPFWDISDNAVHSTCFKQWPEAPAFRERFNQAWRQQVPHHLRLMQADGTIIDAV
ncbi:hypothetical protein [Asticcacaulis sp. YBE204]|uniref:hypothetical protein n=1 Tax=Asticcacaulis sp. YBE204 TaxID=1282363 RepID=UPI0003C41201|nr:hypothetical protein [Asticcacaulis sp. YBE204]ESQ80871.1 hypothetical protein AEYBE204_00695 [Asticcacaulis sp. YBE204]